MTDAREPDFGPARRCGSHAPGHDPHWIQAKMSAEEPRLEELGVVVRIENNSILVDVLGQPRRYHNHDAKRLDQMVHHFGPRVVIQEPWHLLRVPHSGGAYLFCIGADPQWVQCLDAAGSSPSLSP